MKLLLLVVGLYILSWALVMGLRFISCLFEALHSIRSSGMETVLDSKFIDMINYRAYKMYNHFELIDVIFYGIFLPLLVFYELVKVVYYIGLFGLGVLFRVLTFGQLFKYWLLFSLKLLGFKVKMG